MTTTKLVENGTLCSECGVVIDGEKPGHLRDCDPCSEALAKQRQGSRKPDGYAHTYPNPMGGPGRTIQFESNGRMINGSKPIEAIPYYLGTPPTTPEPDAAAPRKRSADTKQARFTAVVHGTCKLLSDCPPEQRADCPTGMMPVCPHGHPGKTCRVTTDCKGAPDPEGFAPVAELKLMAEDRDACLAESEAHEKHARDVLGNDGDTVPSYAALMHVVKQIAGRQS